jgi:hypothetical protein
MPDVQKPQPGLKLPDVEEESNYESSGSEWGSEDDEGDSDADHEEDDEDILQLVEQADLHQEDLDKVLVELDSDINVKADMDLAQEAMRLEGINWVNGIKQQGKEDRDKPTPAIRALMTGTFSKNADLHADCPLTNGLTYPAPINDLFNKARLEILGVPSQGEKDVKIWHDHLQACTSSNKVSLSFHGLPASTISKWRLSGDPSQDLEAAIAAFDKKALKLDVDEAWASFKQGWA